MTVRTTSPFVAAVGLVAVTADGVRRLPGLLFTLPPIVVRQLDDARHAAVARYTELAQHGQDVLAGRPTPDVDLADAVAEAAAADIAAAAERDAAEAAAEAAVVHEPATPEPVEPTPIGLTGPVTIPDDVLEEVAQLTPGAELSHADLPLADFDHLTVPSLRGRLRTLELPQLVQLRDYEQAHAHRLPVLTLLDNRIAKLTAQPAAGQ